MRSKIAPSIRTRTKPSRCAWRTSSWCWPFCPRIKGEVLMAVGLADTICPLAPPTWTGTASLLDHGLSMLVFIACLILEGISALAGRILVITLFFLLTGPVAAHIIGRRAWKRGLPPWRRRRLPEA